MEAIFWQDIQQYEIIEDRPFTHPSHTNPELDTLRHMLEQLCIFMESRHTYRSLYDPIIIDESNGHSHRYLVPQPPKLAEANQLAVVGFFGQKRIGVDPDHFGNLGELLMAEIPTYPKILSYQTMQLPNGNFSNLVILQSEDVKEHWMIGDTHKKAVDHSPSFYESIRIYNGFLPGGIQNPTSFTLEKVKYYDYQENPPWRGIRSLV